MRRPPRLIAAAVSAALLAGASLAAGAASAATVVHGSWVFASAPRQHPPTVRVTVESPSVAPGYVFVAPIANSTLKHPFQGQHGPLMLDNQGNPVWQDPLGGHQVAMNFRPATYQGQPVLTWWEGRITPTGIGTGYDVIANDHYQLIAKVQAGNGFHTDFHEFLITSRGTAYVTAFKAVTANLTGYGGSSNGQVLDSVVQEVDIHSGRVLWQWDPLQAVGLGESYTVPVSGQGWDAYHVNSVDINHAGNLLISARNTWAVYAVTRKTGQISYRLGGKRSDLKLGPGARFAWQHDARFLPGGLVSLFDDEAAPQAGPQSRGIVLRLDRTHRAAHLVQQYTHPKPSLLAGSQGNAEMLPNGNVFVGWGQLPYISEFSASGALLFDAHFHGPDESYRAYRSSWVGQPLTPPSIAISGGSSGSRTVYASWNGATEVTQWQVLTGASQQQLSPSGDPVPRNGFETAISTQAGGPYYAVQALDASGNVLGTSPAVTGG